MKPAISRESVHNESASRGLPEQQPSGQKSAGCSRGTRTSAAMLGLALSVGTTGTFLAPSGEAVAADATVLAALPTVGASPTLPSVGSDRPSGGSAFYHTVAPGETLWDIAKFHRVNVEDIKQANGIGDEPVIQAGQVIKVPGMSNSPAPVAVAAAPRSQLSSMPQASIPQASSLSQSSDATPVKAASEVPLTVQQSLAALTTSERKSEMESPKEPTPLTTGDASTDVSALVGELASVPREVEADRADTTAMAPGDQSLTIAVETSGEAAAASSPTESTNTGAQQVAVGRIETPVVAAPVRHQIRRGETLSTIARQYGISTTELARANSISNPNRIFVGRTLVIPQSAPQATAPEPLVPAPIELASLEPFRLPRANRPQAPVAPEATRTRDEGDEANAADLVTPEVALPVQAAPELALDGVEEAIPSDSVAADPYVANLLARVQTAREEAEEAAASSTQVTSSGGANPTSSEFATEVPFQVAASSPQSVERATVNTAPIPVNPEFRPNENGLQSEQPVTLPERELLAAAPLGSEVYAPLTESPTGRVVSPSMPILPDSSEYLPEAPNRFNGYIWPAQGVLSSGYGWRWGRMHRGIDIAGPVGTPIVAAATGVVVTSGWNSGGYGNMVDIRHPDGSLTRYAHHSRNLVQAGQQVRQGQQIAEMGSTGFSTGPHLHFEVHIPNQGTVNPIALLPGR
ncbi:peptidoglycan DD-metalloendopeptidase family protein [Leptolyngbya sp. PCC 6406]|uniref:peptidoglycan DD-metalloendopeptidase family protein n=1 Tax=Leptolyngbya sp. PCC 6406 TaxID=1173264 RepID=UPI00138B1A67|nr:peptidoglycan DD-metalloendopeptidase family protein [Leptolyngbya sp. PCC 6406]